MACADGSFSRQGIPRPRCVTLRSPFSFALCPARHVAVWHGQTKKGAVSNHFLSMLRCQRGLNSSLRSSDSAARDGSRSWKENSKKQLPFFVCPCPTAKHLAGHRPKESGERKATARTMNTLTRERTSGRARRFFYLYLAGNLQISSRRIFSNTLSILAA